MNLGSTKRFNPILSCILLFMLPFLGVVTDCYGFSIEIDVAPNTLNIQSNGVLVTVHTDISYNSVISSSVTLNGIEIKFSKVDNRGNFVAKFDMSAVKDLVEEGHLELGVITLTLEGMTRDNEEFTGSQEINVVNIQPVGRK